MYADNNSLHDSIIKGEKTVYDNTDEINALSEELFEALYDDD